MVAKKLIPTLTLAVALLAAACGGDDDDTTSGGNGGEESGTPVDGGTLTVDVDADFLGFDPIRLGGVPDVTAAASFYDTLTARQEREIRPWLAESLEPNEDFTSWDLELRPDITFHDDTPLDAEAVKFNVERHMDPANASLVQAHAAPIESVTVIDDLTVTFKLKSPWAQFPNALATSVGMMASPTALQEQGENYAQHPVGTGPYQFDEWVSGSSLTVTKTDSYWTDEHAGHADEIVYKVFTEPESAFAALQSGELDIMRTPIPSTMEEAEQAGLNVVTLPDRALTTVLNSSKPPFDDPRVRQALAYATDNEALIETIQEGKADLARPFPEDHAFHDSDLDWPQFDPDEAEALLEDYGEPVKLTYGCDNTPDGNKLAELIEQMWEDVGVEVDLAIEDQATRIDRVLKRNYDAECWAQANQPWTEPDIGMFIWFHSASAVNVSPTSTDAQADLDDVLLAGRQSADESERADAYAGMEEILAEEMPWIWHYNPEVGFLSSSRTKGMAQEDMTRADAGIAPVRDVWIEE